MTKLRLLPGEQVRRALRPHVLSFLPKYFLGLFFAAWAGFLAWLFRTAWWQDADSGAWYEVWTFLYGNSVAAAVYAVVGAAVVGAVVSVATVRWRIFFGYLATTLAVVGVVAWADLAWETWLPVGLAVAAVPWVLGAEMDRRSHRYVLTNLRIILGGGLTVRRERQIRYEAITDLDSSQGPLGRMFGYGTVIPVTQSGFGLGSDTSQAAIGAGVGGGGSAKVGIGVMAGGGKEVQTGRARTFHQLTGVHPFDDVRYDLEGFVQEATATPYLREQVELQRKLLKRLGGDEPDAQSL